LLVDTERLWRVGEALLVALFAVDVCLLLGLAIIAFRHPLVILAAPIVAMVLYSVRPFRPQRWQVVAAIAVVLLAIPFLVSPLYLGR
jgi:hypothetical protein